MQKYIVLIGENNPEVFNKVTNKLVSLGFRFSFDFKDWFVNHKFIYLNYKNQSSTITTGTLDSTVGHHLQDHTYTLLTSEYVLEHGEELEGCSKRVKSLTVAQISDLLGYEVEVIKG